MKVVVLCGGKGSRLSEETRFKPKPMVKIGSKPILEHIIKIYTKYGYKNFIFLLGYKGYLIKNFFSKKKTNLNFKFINTGINTGTGGRLLMIKKYFDYNENFMLTYGDGLSNQNINKLVKYHLSHKKIATMTVVRPPARFGEVRLNGKKIKLFTEKPQINSGWINGGFFVFNYKIFHFIKKYSDMLEKKPLEKVSQKNQLMAYKHENFWQCMDTLRDKNLLNKLIKNNKAPWIK
jgi:glucose-1-phosphate cytidylyltransferase